MREIENGARESMRKGRRKRKDNEKKERKEEKRGVRKGKDRKGVRIRGKVEGSGRMGNTMREERRKY